MTNECSLLLALSKGKVFTTLKCSMVIKSPEARENCHLALQAEENKKPKKNKGRKKKRLESLLAFHQRLVDERGLPPSRLMLEQAAQAQSSNHSEGSQRPETLRHSVLDHSLNSSYPNEEREEISSVNADKEPDVEEVERIQSILEETNKCYFCEYEAPVPWIHPSKGDNLSGMDIWDHVWNEHPQESEWFA